VQPPSTPTNPDEPLYETFFGLREQPFSLTSDPRFLFMSDAHRRAYEELLTGLRRREGLLLLTADTGLGKTTLCRALIDAVGPRTFSALIQNPYMSDIEVVRVILREFGLVSRDDIRKGAFGRADMPQLLDTLEQFLRSLIPLNSYAVLIIDEAQSLPPKVLDQIRMLGSYEQDGQRLLQVILSGQPGLLQTLRTDAMRAVDGRVSRRAIISALSTKDVEAYVGHRLSIAGGANSVEFAPDSCLAVAKLSQGVPRHINLLCDRALEEGRVAGATVISAAMVHRAARLLAGGEASAAPEGTITLPDDPADEKPLSSGFDRSPIFGEEPVEAPPSRRLTWLAILLIATLLAAAGYLGWTTVEGAGATTPGLPATPARAARPPDPKPLPPLDDVRYVMEEMRRNRGGLR
jgi:general secretion pathway protein A